MECSHLLEHGCTYCSGKDTTREQPRRKAGPPRPRGRKAPDLLLAAKVAAGIICGDCLGEVAQGCPCSRRKLLLEDLPDSRDWLEVHEGEFIRGDRDAARAIVGARRAVTGMAFATATRASRRAGLTADEVADDRADILGRFDVEPAWQKPRRQEADHLPV